MALFWARQQRTHLGGPYVPGWSTLARWCTLKSAAPLSGISHITMRDGRTPLYMLPQSSYLSCIAQIDCGRSVDSQVEGIYLVRVVSCACMSSLVACLGTSLWFATGSTMRPLLFWDCTPQTWHAFSWGQKLCQRTSLLYRPSPRTRCQGSYWRRNLDLHHILVRTLISSSLIWVRKRESFILLGLRFTICLGPHL